MARVKTKESELKRQKTVKENKEKEQQTKQELARKVQEETKEMLLPSIRNKMNEVAEVIREKVSGVDGLKTVEIMQLIAKRSTADIATIRTKTFTPYELGEAFNIYIDMIAEINKFQKFPPSKGSFCTLLGITPQTYDNYLCDPDKREIMEFIDSYISTSKLTSAQIGELKEIPVIFDLKAQHGFIEQQAPVVIEHKKTTDIAEINAQLSALKGDGIIKEAEWEEKDEQDISS